MSDFNVDWNAAPTMLGDGMEYAAVALGKDAEYDATFYMGKLPNFDESAYTEVPHLRLRAPGDRLSIYDQPVRFESSPSRPSDPERFPSAWIAFKNGHNTDGLGTPLANWDLMREADIRRLEINGVQTIEQLAAVADRHLDGLGLGGRILRDQARSYLGARPKVDHEKAELRSQVEKLTDVVNGLLSRLGPEAISSLMAAPTDSIIAPDVIPETAPKPRRQRATEETEHAE